MRKARHLGHLSEEQRGSLRGCVSGALAPEPLRRVEACGLSDKELPPPGVRLSLQVTYRSGSTDPPRRCRTRPSACAAVSVSNWFPAMWSSPADAGSGFLTTCGLRGQYNSQPTTAHVVGVVPHQVPVAGPPPGSRKRVGRAPPADPVRSWGILPSNVPRHVGHWPGRGSAGIFHDESSPGCQRRGDLLAAEYALRV